MANRFGTNSAMYDLSRLMTFATGVPAQNIFSAPIVLDNPAITSGMALFGHTSTPWSVAVPAANELRLFDLNFANTGLATSQFYGIKIQTNADVVDTGAGIAIFNAGRADSIYLGVAGKTGNPAGNSPTGIGIDINKEIAGANENDSANSSQQGVQIWDHSQTDQGVGGPRCLFLNKYLNMNTDHFLATFKANRNALQFVMEAADGEWDGTKPLVRVDDSDSGITWWQIRQSAEQIFNKDGIGIQWITPGAKTAYILASTNDLKLKSGGTGIRFVNQADTQTIVMMQDDLSVDIINNETRFQAIKIVSDRIEQYSTNGLGSVSINYNGYNGGTTQFRDTKIFDGKQNVVAMFTGTYKDFLIGTSTDKATTQPHLFFNDGTTLMQQGGTSTGYAMLMWNLWSDNGTFKRRIATNPTTALYVGPGSGAGAVEIYFNTDAGNTVDSTATLSRYYHFGPTTIGFLGAGPTVKPTSTTDLRQALIDIGLYTTGGATPLNLNGGLLTAGSIAQATLKASGVHKSTDITYISGTGTAGVDNTAQTVKSLTLAANSLTQVGDRLRIRCYWTGTTGSPITGTTKLGPAGSEVTVSHTTDGGAATLQLNEAWIHYIDNTHSNIIENEAGALGAVSAVNVAGFTWNASQDIILTQDQISNNHIVVYALIVDIFPKGVA